MTQRNLMNRFNMTKATAERITGYVKRPRDVLYLEMTADTQSEILAYIVTSGTMLQKVEPKPASFVYIDGFGKRKSQIESEIFDWLN